MVLIGLIVVTGFVVSPLIVRRQRLVNLREAASVRMSGHVADVLSNMDTVRAFAAEEREAAENARAAGRGAPGPAPLVDYGNLRVDMVVAPMSIITSTVGVLLAVVLRGGLGIEALMVTFTYYSQATGIMFEFNQVYRRMESVLTEAGQFTELLLDPPKVVDRPTRSRRAWSSGAVQGGVRFERVVFAHEGNPPLFDGLDLDVPAGTKIGLVGRSGGGKTTLTRLLLRLMDIQGGRILVDGQDIGRMRQSDLRGLIAYVPQEPAMFHRTLRENIAFARPGATEAEILEAARAAHVTEFVEEPADGVRHPGRRARREAVGRPASAGRAGAGDPARRADPAARRGHQRARLRERDPRPGGAVAAHARPDRAGGGPPAEHGRADGPPGRARPGRDRRAGLPRGTAGGAGPYSRLWHHQSGGFLVEEEAETVSSASGSG